jgi:Zn-dependent metalloprotease
MKQIIFALLVTSCASIVFGQTSLKHITPHPGSAHPFHIARDIPSLAKTSRLSGNFYPSPLCNLNSSNEKISSQKISSSGSFWIELNDNEMWSARSSVTDLMTSLLSYSVSDNKLPQEWSEVSEEKDPQQITHVRVRQMLAGYPIHGQDMILHLQHNKLRDLNGFAWTGPLPYELPVTVSEAEAKNTAIQYLKNKGIPFQPIHLLKGMQKPNDDIQLTWFPEKGKLLLVYEIHMHPNMLDQWTLFIKADDLVVIKAFSQLCSIFPEQLYHIPHPTHQKIKTGDLSLDKPAHANLLGDGPTTTTDQDLLGLNRTVNAYLIGTNFFMIDASRNMFDPVQSVLPNEPTGVIWTVDGQNGSPQKDNFEVIHVTNTNNNWKNLEVSAHFNAGQAFEYFRQTFNRNSINGDGGNIISIINITDENGNDLDNAFWSGTAMFYGNGDVAFNFPLAKALDVGGHEMSHGVIQNTANLEYVGQSGALNESYADVFGAMIDRNDWQIGEDVSNPAIFPTGALRDMSNPHNGGTNSSDAGWQPAHMNEFQNLPDTPEGDNGGVHINSGIPNKAFSLLATSIGKEKAEQIYYKALRDYLVKSSQFIDMRLAVEKAAADLHGATSAEVLSVRSAFDAVGIGAGQGGNYEDDLEVNEGDDFIIATDEQESDLYWIPPSNPGQFVKLQVPAPQSRPSFTDDGTDCVYVDQSDNLILIHFDWSAGLNYNVFNLEDNPQGGWRNIVVSKDGEKIAFTTSELTNEIWVYDFTSNTSQNFILFNPTTAQGLSTGDVLYADAMEWDYSGEFIMYDALNRIESNFGDGIEYWDISFLEAWDNETDNFGLGQIEKLFNTLPENISVGNPSFAKNSPYIITFDFLETIRDNFGQELTDYRIKAANLEQGIVNDIFINTTVGYPSYSRLDDQILFTYDDQGMLDLAIIDLQPADKTLPVVGSAEFFVTGAQKGVWFQTGDRIFTGVENTAPSQSLHLWPQPAVDDLYMTWDQPGERAEFKIFDIYGRQVNRGSIESGESIHLSSILPGSYFIQLLMSDHHQLRSRFVKQ